MNDIKNIGDIILLVDRFYKKVNSDHLLSRVFNDFAKVNWEEHLPVMYSFWSAVLFDTSTYKGQPLTSHINLPINTEHFQRWLELFRQTVDENFEGEKAEEAKGKADSIALIFQTKLGLISDNPRIL
jgi:hemoglobin